jgi:hypothetical protein
MDGPHPATRAITEASDPDVALSRAATLSCANSDVPSPGGSFCSRPSGTLSRGLTHEQLLLQSCRASAKERPEC